jgi:GcrA cell cycle regulator
MEPSWWTDERIEELKARWANRESGSMIAIAMGARSRNAVVGKLYRLGLRRDQEPMCINGHRGPRSARRAKASARKTVHYVDGRVFIVTGETEVIEEPISFAKPKTFITLETGDCHWPGAGVVGPDLLCCAAPVAEGYPYCRAHCRLAYVRPGATPKAPRS